MIKLTDNFLKLTSAKLILAEVLFMIKKLKIDLFFSLRFLSLPITNKFILAD